MKSIIALVLFFLVNHFSFAQSAAMFSREQVTDDLNYLYHSLKDAHYDLYAYTSEREYDSVYAEIKKSITQDSLSLLRTTSLYQRLISKVNNGHTEIDFPGQSYGTYAYGGGTIFPLEVAFEYGIPLVRKNYSTNDSIVIGSELLSINGLPMSEILSQIYPQISAERLYLKNAKLEMYSFPRYYWQVFGKQDRFEIEVQQNNATKKYSIEAVDLIEGYEMKRSEVLNAEMTLQFFNKVAYLNPGNFSGDEEKFRQFIDSSFVAIKAKKSENLIVDLRNNGGGDNAFSDYLVSYFADRPFDWNSSFSLKTSNFLKEHVRIHNDTAESYFKEVLDRQDGEVYSYNFETHQPQPKNRRFMGKVYVLINRQSHSQSAVAAAQIQDYGFGTIVGEETGDYPSLYASQFQYLLPNTKIPVKVSKGRIIRVNGNTDEKGVIPDIFIKDHLIDEEDEILKETLVRIAQIQ